MSSTKTRNGQQPSPGRRTSSPLDTLSADDHRWTFLTNHAHVLAILASNSEIVLREVAVQVGITERAVQRIVQDLEEGGYIERERIGRRNHYSVHRGLSLRHPIEAHCTIGDLLKLISNE
ncbi:MAG: winged helix-turn-helix transcriptional regulator [Planctomycetaceae bacterium]|nr:winged helix-turn-helix transcriptional regulator [Planctomycetaceae bacterium]